MSKSLVRPRRILIPLLVIVLLVTTVWFVDVRDLCAHTPHDNIDALKMSPDYGHDQTLFIVTTYQLLKSIDGGFSWKELVNGLDNRKRLSSIAISPSYRLDETVFVSSKGDGIYRSQDGGHSWVKVNDGLGSLNMGLLSIYPDYDSNRIVLAAGIEGGLYRTENGGDSWEQAMDDGIWITSLAFSPDLGRDDVVVGDREGRLYTSRDSGKTWQQTQQIPNAGAITAIAISPSFSSDSTIFVGTEKNGVLKTTDGGDSFAEANKGLPFTPRAKYATFRVSAEGPAIRRDEKAILSLALSPDYETDATVLASMWNQAIYKSSNGGKSWKRYSLGLTCDAQADASQYKSPHFRDLCISTDFAQDGTIFLGGFDGLFKSTDSGRQWQQMETLPLRLIKGLTVSPGDRDGATIAITTYGGGAYTTCDQGTTWVSSNRGLDTTRLSDITFSPAYLSDDFLLSASRGFILRSTNSGSTWEKTKLRHNENWTTPLKRRMRSVLNILGIPSYFHRRILTTLEREQPFATMLAISPNFASDSTFYFATRLHGVYKSVDGGISASAIWDAMGHSIRFLVISPDFPSDNTLYASLRGMGVYKTVDGGQTWQSVNNGLTFVQDWQSPTSRHEEIQDIQLFISPHYKTDGTVFAASVAGLFKTTDRGDSWQKLKALDQGKDSYVVAMAISPDYANDGILIVSVKGRGLFKTDNSGKTFTEIGPSIVDTGQSIEFITFSASYATDGTIYAASEEELLLSTDKGATWTVIDRPVRYENRREVVRYDGEWHTSTSDDFSASSVSHTDVAHSKATLTFVGTGIAWIGTGGSDHGIARVYIDGNHAGDVDQFDDARKTMVESFTRTDLACGPHTITIEVTDTKNPRSTGHRVEIDAFDVVQEQGCW